MSLSQITNAPYLDIKVKSVKSEFNNVQDIAVETITIGTSLSCAGLASFSDDTNIRVPLEMGNLNTTGYIIPNVGGVAGQVLAYPLNGKTLQWVNGGGGGGSNLTNTDNNIVLTPITDGYNIDLSSNILLSGNITSESYLQAPLITGTTFTINNQNNTNSISLPNDFSGNVPVGYTIISNGDGTTEWAQITPQGTLICTDGNLQISSVEGGNDIILSDDITINDTLDVSNNLYVGNDLNVGNVLTTLNLLVTESMGIDQDFRVDGSGVIGGTLQVNTNFIYNGSTLQSPTNATIGQYLQIDASYNMSWADVSGGGGVSTISAGTNIDLSGTKTDPIINLDINENLQMNNKDLLDARYIWSGQSDASNNELYLFVNWDEQNPVSHWGGLVGLHNEYVYIGTDSDNNTWTFDSSGNLTVPPEKYTNISNGTILNAKQIINSNTPFNSSMRLAIQNNDLTREGEILLDPSGVKIYNNNETNIWTFDNSGVLNNPLNGNINMNGGSIANINDIYNEYDSSNNSIDLYVNTDINTKGGNIHISKTDLNFYTNNNNNLLRYSNTGSLTNTINNNQIWNIDASGNINSLGGLSVSGLLTVGDCVYPNVKGNQNQILSASGIGGGCDFVNGYELFDSSNNTISITENMTNGKTNLDVNLNYSSNSGSVDIDVSNNVINIDNKLGFNKNVIEFGNSQGGKGGGSCGTKTNFSNLNVQSFDMSGVSPYAYGFGGMCFDGKYIYFVPNNNISVTDGLFIRYDINKQFNNNTAYETFDLTTLNANCKGFGGCCIAYPYIYLFSTFIAETVPIVYDTNIVRYDMRLPFNNSSSYLVFDMVNVSTDLYQLYGGIYDGDSYIYFMANNTTLDKSYLIQYNINLGFQNPSSYQYTEINPNNNNYPSMAFDGQFIYIIPNSGSILFKYDTTVVFGSAGLYQFDLSTLNASVSNMSYGCFDGRYLYLSCGSTGYIVKYDTTKDFTQSTNYSIYQLSNNTYQCCLFDGRFVYFMGTFSTGTTPTGDITYYDITQSFTDSNSYKSINMTLSNEALLGFGSCICDGKYIYVATSYNISEVLEDSFICRFPCYKGPNLGPMQLLI